MKQIACFIISSALLALAFHLVFPDGLPRIGCFVLVLLALALLWPCHFGNLDKDYVDFIYYSAAILGVFTYFLAGSIERQVIELSDDLASVEQRISTIQSEQESHSKDQRILSMQATNIRQQISHLTEQLASPEVDLYSNPDILQQIVLSLDAAIRRIRTEKTYCESRMEYERSWFHQFVTAPTNSCFDLSSPQYNSTFCWDERNKQQARDQGRLRFFERCSLVDVAIELAELSLDPKTRDFVSIDGMVTRIEELRHRGMLHRFVFGDETPLLEGLPAITVNGKRLAVKDAFGKLSEINDMYEEMNELK